MFYELIISFAISIDIFVTSFSYAAASKKISLLGNFIICFVSSIVLLLSIMFSAYLSGFLTYSECMKIGAVLLFLIGLYNIAKSFSKKNSVPRELDLKSTFLLSAVLATDALASGIASGFMNISALFSGIFCMIFSAAAVVFGNIIGKYLRSKLKKTYNLNWVGGAALILIAIVRGRS